MRAERQLQQRLLDRVLDYYGMHLSPWSGDGYLVGGAGRVTRHGRPEARSVGSMADYGSRAQVGRGWSERARRRPLP